MITLDGYTIMQFPLENKIVISLPQTVSTLTNTVTPVVNRRKIITDNEEAALLVAIKGMFEWTSEVKNNKE